MLTNLYMMSSSLVCYFQSRTSEINLAKHHDLAPRLISSYEDKSRPTGLISFRKLRIYLVQVG